MLVEDGKYYLYRHRRESDGTPFYIGIGTKVKGGKKDTQIYPRAFNVTQRNKYWKKVYNKHGLIVDILLHSDCLEFIGEKEKEFISLYGQSIFNNGILTNVEGGGVLNTDRSFANKSICCCNDKREFTSIQEAADYYNIDRTSINRHKQAYNLVFKKSLEDCNNLITKVELTEGEYLKPVKGFEEDYLVSNMGRIVKVAKNIKDDTGEALLYEENEVQPVKRGDRLQCTFSVGNKRTTQDIKKLVGENFLGSAPEGKPYLVNINGDFFNCKLENLEYSRLRNKDQYIIFLNGGEDGYSVNVPLLNGGKSSFKEKNYDDAVKIRDSILDNLDNFGNYDGLKEDLKRRKFISKESGISYSNKDKRWGLKIKNTDGTIKYCKSSFKTEEEAIAQKYKILNDGM